MIQSKKAAAIESGGKTRSRRMLPIMKSHEIKKVAQCLEIFWQHTRLKCAYQAHVPGNDVELCLILGASTLAGKDNQEPLMNGELDLLLVMKNIPTHDPESFGKNHTLSTVLWLLVQHGKVKIDENPHFYNAEMLVASSLNSGCRIDPHGMDWKLRRKGVLHVLIDKRCCLVIRTPDSSFCRNFGNIWSLHPGQHDPVKIVKRSLFLTNF